MHIEVLAVHLDMTDSLSDYIRHRIELSLDRFESHIDRVIVRVEDISGPHGPGTKRCHVEVTMPRRESVIVEQDHNDIYTAVDKASTRLKRTVRRQINRLRDAKRSHQHRVSNQMAWA